MSNSITDMSKVKRCKPVSEGGCGEYKAIEDFPVRKRIRKSGEVVVHLVNWCRKCEREKERIRRGVEAKARLPDIRYVWDQSRGSYRVIHKGRTVAVRQDETSAIIECKKLQTTKDISEVFFTLPTHGLKWDKETCTLKSVI